MRYPVLLLGLSTVLAAQALLVGPHKIRLAQPPSGAIAVRHEGNVRKPFTFKTASLQGGDWLTANLVAGATNVTPSWINVSPKLAELPPGLYKGTVTIESEGNPPVTVQVERSVTLTPPSGPPTSITVYHQAGSDRYSEPVELPAALGVSPGFLQLITGGPWLLAASASFEEPGAIRADGRALPEGVYKAAWRSVVGGTTTADLPAVIAKLVVGKSPVLSTSEKALRFVVYPGQREQRSFEILSSDDITPLDPELSVITAEDKPYLTATLAGEDRMRVQVEVDTTGLSDGIYQGSVTVSSKAALNPPLVVPVTITVTSETLVRAYSQDPARVAACAEKDLLQPEDGRKLCAVDEFSMEFRMPSMLPDRQPGAIEILREDGSPAPPFQVRVESSGNWVTAAKGPAGKVLLWADHLSTSFYSQGDYRAAVVVESPQGALLLRIPLKATAYLAHRQILTNIKDVTIRPGQSGGVTVQVNSSGAALPFRVSSDAKWVTLSVTRGHTGGTITIGVDATLLESEGTQVANVRIEGRAPNIAPATVRVVLDPDATVLPALPPAQTVYVATPTEVRMERPFLQENPPGMRVDITAPTFSSPVRFSVTTATDAGGDWLGAGVFWNGLAELATQWSTPANLTVHPRNTKSLPPGTYTGSVGIGSTNNATHDTLKIPVTLTVTGTSGPQARLNPDSIALTMRLADTRPQTQSIRVEGLLSTPQMDAVCGTSGGKWLTRKMAPGNTLELVTLPSAIRGPGNYWCELILWSDRNAPATLPVTLQVQP